jgi:hypothetical protein
MKVLFGEFEEGALRRIFDWVMEGVDSCMERGAYVGAMVLMCFSIDVLSSFYVGSRRGILSHSGRRFIRFIRRYFSDFVMESTDSRGHFLKKRVAVNYKGGKAGRRMDYPSILNFWYRRGMIHDVVFKEGLTSSSQGVGRYFLYDPAFTVLFNVERFYIDFKRALEAFYQDLKRDIRLQENFRKRFLSLYGIKICKNPRLVI